MRRLQFGVPEFAKDRLLVSADFQSLPETPGAALLELPCRPLGGQLHAFEDLEAIRDWASDKQVPLHLDGARIWQCRPFYNKTYAEIAALFDSLYVSFYKDLGGLCGCMLVGPAELIAAARMWQRRHGGNLYTQSPYVESARLAMHRVLPQIDNWVQRAGEVAGILDGFDKIRINPNPPHANFFQVFIEGDAETLNQRHLALAEETGTWLFNPFSPSVLPGFASTELHLWENAMAFDLSALPPMIERLLA